MATGALTVGPKPPDEMRPIACDEVSSANKGASARIGARPSGAMPTRRREALFAS